MASKIKKDEKFSTVTKVKAMSRTLFGQVATVRSIPNKKFKASRYPHKIED